MFSFIIFQPKLLCFSWVYDPELFWAVLHIGSVLLDWFSASQEGSQENRRRQTTAIREVISATIADTEETKGTKQGPTWEV